MFGDFCLQDNERRTGWPPEGPPRGQGLVFEDRAEEPAPAELRVPAAPAGRGSGVPAQLVPHEGTAIPILQMRRWGLGANL